MDKKPFTGKNHGTDPIDLTHLKTKPQQYKPIEIHLKENEALDDGPSVCIVLERPSFGRRDKDIVFGQLSIEMLNEGLKDIGYKLVKI